MLANLIAVFIGAGVACARKYRTAIDAEATKGRVDGNPISGFRNGNHFPIYGNPCRKLAMNTALTEKLELL